MKTLKDAFAKREFVMTCEIVPGRGREGVTVDAAVRFAEEIAAADVQVHAVSLTDNPGGNPAIMPDALSREILDRGLDVLVHFSCRDFNRNAFESRAMALARAGAQNLLVITGDYPASGFEGDAAPVFDLDAVQGIRYLRAMNRGLEIPTPRKRVLQKLAPTDFLLGAVVSPFKLTEAEYMCQLFKLEKKLAQGAHFVVPQLGFDMRKFFELKRYVTARGLTVPMLGNVYVLNRNAARAMHAGRIPGCVVTEELLAIVEKEAAAPDKGKNASLERAAKMVAALQGMGYGGVHIGGFGLKSENVCDILRRAREFAPRWRQVARELEFARQSEYCVFPARADYGAAPPDPDPVPLLGTCRKPFVYRLSDWFHRRAFEPDGVLYRPLRAYYRWLENKPVTATCSHFLEYAAKWFLFRCRDCGDCALPEMAGCCPQSGCPKQQRNGACGGSTDGMCEVYPEKRRCVWMRVYRRLKSAGRLPEMRTGYVPPRRTELDRSSAWSNYFCGRDHAERE